MKGGVFIKIYSVIKDGDTVILTQDEESQPGWKFPGGHVEKGELLIPAALREVEEETGFKVSVTGLLLIEDFFNRKRPNEHDMRFFIITELIGGEEKLKSGEVKSLKRFTKSELEILKEEEFYSPHWNALKDYLQGNTHQTSLLKKVDG